MGAAKADGTFANTVRNEVGMVGKGSYMQRLKILVVDKRLHNDGKLLSIVFLFIRSKASAVLRRFSCIEGWRPEYRQSDHNQRFSVQAW